MVQNKESMLDGEVINPEVRATISNKRANAEDIDLQLGADADQQNTESRPDIPNSPSRLVAYRQQSADIFEQEFEVPEEEIKFVGEYDHLVGPSGVAGAVVGLLVGGPIIAAVAGFGTAYAVRKEGTAGDIARALGEVALSARARALEVDREHRFAEKAKRAVDDLSRKHKIAAKTKEFARASWKAAVDLDRRHKLLERGVEGTGRGFEYIAERVSGGETPQDYAKVPTTE